MYCLARNMGVEVAAVSVPDADDRLAIAARQDGVPHVLWRIHDWGRATDCDLIVAAHSFEIVPASALAAAGMGGIGYHPSLLPCHRGRSAVARTIEAGDEWAGGSVYRLTRDVDAGTVLYQDRVRVIEGETPRDLWRRALCPMGLALLSRALLDASLGRLGETEPGGSTNLHRPTLIPTQSAPARARIQGGHA